MLKKPKSLVMKSLIQLTCFAGILVLFSNFSFGQTFINSGPVNGTWTLAGSPYYIQGDINILSDSTLIIEAGVVIKFANVYFYIYGQLLALGIENDSIDFMPHSTYSQWKGMFISNSTDTCKFRYCNFQGFSKNTNGGVINATNSCIKIEHSVFSNNGIWDQIGLKGGAICFDSCYVYINYSSFISNYCDTYSFIEMSVSSYGGAISWTNGKGLIKNSLFSNNVLSVGNESWDYYPNSEAKGGAIYISANSRIEDNVFIGNHCSASATYFDLKKQDLKYVQKDMDAYGYGGAICAHGESKISNNLILENECHAGTNIWTSSDLESKSSMSKGGGIYFNDTLINCTILFNNSDDAGSGTYGSILKNCIVWGNTGPSSQVHGYASYSCIHNGHAGIGNISGYPNFIDGQYGPYYLKQAPCQSQTSPCVDAGDPNTSVILGTTRTDEFPDMGIVDMGFHYPSNIEMFLSANFFALPLYGDTPFEVQFFDSSTVNITQIDQWLWDFQCDGEIDSYIQNPIWVFNDPGAYSVQLIVMDTSGLISDTLFKENYITVCEIVPDFYSDKTYGIAPLEINFFDTTSCLNTSISEYQWDFQSDGIIDSYDQNPNWVYESTGIFSVKLTVIDTSGYIHDSITKVNYIEVYPSAIDFNQYNDSKNFFIYPNPFTNTLYIKYFDDRSDQVSVSMHDHSFKIVAEILKKEEAKPGENIWTWNVLNELESGLYYIVLTTGNERKIVKKIIRVH